MKGRRMEGGRGRKEGGEGQLREGGSEREREGGREGESERGREGWTEERRIEENCRSYKLDPKDVVQHKYSWKGDKHPSPWQQLHKQKVFFS